MDFNLSFLSAVAMAGIASLLGEMIIGHVPFLKKRIIPGPGLGGLIFAIGFLVLRGFDIRVEFPVSGRPVDFLVALLTTNMGMHITPKILGKNYLLFPAFLGVGVILFFAQLLVVLPIMLFEEHPLRMAILTGPVAFVGAPFNLNPPQQIPPIAEYFQPAITMPEQLAQANMVIGIIVAVFLAGIVGRHLFERAGEEPPKQSPQKRDAEQSIWDVSMQEFTLLVAILSIIAVAFWFQDILLERLTWLKEGYLPVIVLSYLMGVAARLIFDLAVGDERFPDRPLNVLLFGPTMSLVLAYAVMSAPLAQLAHVRPTMVLAAIVSIAASTAMAWMSFSIFSRIVNRYYAAGIATVFLAVTTAWGPVAMSYLHRITEEKGPIEPIPIALPLNAFFVFPWMASLLTMLLLGVIF